MSCGLAPAISAGTNVVVGNDATYTCNTGYKMDGRPQVHCIGGTWTGTPPTCFLLNAEPTNNYWLDVFNTQDESKSNKKIQCIAYFQNILVMCYCIIYIYIDMYKIIVCKLNIVFTFKFRNTSDHL